MILRRCAVLVVLAVTLVAAAVGAPKREFRGAWIQTIFQKYEERTSEQLKADFTGLLDRLHAVGINVVIFQVRPCADAFYQSSLEPWSRYLTGSVGRAPKPFWDPLEFMVTEAHLRGMELHAWLNPYRAPTVKDAASLSSSHLLKRHPERFVRYGNGYYFDPSREDNRRLICNVVADIVTRYDVDGIHFDDYFYPYPVKGQKFPDAEAYARSASGLSLNDWRRSNVNELIRCVSETIDSIKPWVRFGISPFGIWRNSSSDPSGSRTAGLQAYDDLYSDVPLWAEKGWIDYQIPQLYWELDHERASYRELAQWWAQNGRGRHVYIGQDARKTHQSNELDPKLKLASAVEGNCWWYASSLKCIEPELAEAYTTPALVPEYLWKKAEVVSTPSDLKFAAGLLRWAFDEKASKWVVYRFDSEKVIDIENPSAICAVTYSNQFTPTRPGVYVVTALDRTNCESVPSAPIAVKL